MSLSRERERDLHTLEGALGIRFHDLTLLHVALTHSSYANEQGDMPYNERLEFLGDAVVGLVVSDLLFSKFPDEAEGELARAKAMLVSAASMSRIGQELQLSRYILLGRGEKRSRGRGRESIIADAVEAMIGAVYLDQPWDVTHSLVSRLWKPLISSLSDSPAKVRDAKSTLQELLQARGEGTPQYRLKKAFGPDHAKTFLSEVIHDGKVLGVGKGHSKREAEQEAARQALKDLLGR